jgi:hypothetical protein
MFTSDSSKAVSGRSANGMTNEKATLSTQKIAIIVRDWFIATRFHAKQRISPLSSNSVNSQEVMKL